MICSLILAVTLAVCQALADATSNLGWLLAFALQATFLWMVFVQRERLTTDLLKATVGPSAAYDKTNRLQTLYYSTRLAQIARRTKSSSGGSSGGSSSSPPSSAGEAASESAAEAPPAA